MRALFLILTSAAALPAADWPQWMGPTRDGVWTEDGILDALPAGGPVKKWSKPLAGGYSGPAVVKGCVYVMDYLKTSGDDKPDPGTRNELTGVERVHCLDSATGERKWLRDFLTPYHVSYPSGPRCTPTVDEGRVYCLGTMGHLVCLNANTGATVWETDFVKAFDAKVPIWGFAGHPLIYKNLLITLAGGPDALVVAFDKVTGRVAWKSQSTSDDGPGYCPPSIIEAGGTTQLVLWHPLGVVSLNPETGKLHWKQPLKPSYGMSIMMPRKGGDILYAGGIGNAGVALKLNATSPNASVAWQGLKNNGLYPANSTPLVVGDTLYGVDVQGELRAVTLSTGRRLWETTEPAVNALNKPTSHGTAFLVRNGERFFLFNEQGNLIVAKLTPESYTKISQAKLIEPTTAAFNRTVVWSHPAFAEKSIFVRNDKEIACFSLAK